MLALAAGQLVRVPAAHLLSQADLFQRRGHRPVALLAGSAQPQ